MTVGFNVMWIGICTPPLSSYVLRVHVFGNVSATQQRNGCGTPMYPNAKSGLRKPLWNFILFSQFLP